jgi:hypothetical protein
VKGMGREEKEGREGKLLQKTKIRQAEKDE